MWKTVEEFAEWYKNNKHPLRPPTTDPIYRTDFSYSVVIYRNGRFQVELFYLRPNCSVTTLHAPGIDQCIIFLNGQITVYKDNQVLYDTTELTEVKTDQGTSVLFNQIFKFDGGEIDRVDYGPKGASLMSVQMWHDDIEMTSMSKQKGLLI
jgi:hypothetical protein